MGAYFLRSLGQCVGAQNGPRWHQTRYHLEQFFSAIEAASMITDFQRVLNTWAQTLPENAASQQIGDRKFLTDSVEICRQLPFRMIAMCLYGNMLTSEVSILSVCISLLIISAIRYAVAPQQGPREGDAVYVLWHLGEYALLSSASHCSK